MDFADRHGIVVIDETPAVGLNYSIGGGIFVGSRYQPGQRRDAMTVNRMLTPMLTPMRSASLVHAIKFMLVFVLWSIANEPSSGEEGAQEYFEPLVKLARELDHSSPITFANVMNARFGSCMISDLFDVFCLNRYYGWYMNTGDLASAEVELENELRGWESKYGRSIIVTEYGTDTANGVHSVRDQPWSEEHQIKYNDTYHRVFDRISAMTGEQVWNFADFQTAAGVFRVDGNKKGIFTRDRKSKGVAHTLRKRWTQIRSQGH